MAGPGAVLVAFAGGCATPPPQYAASGPSDQVVLDARQQADVLRTFAGVAAGHVQQQTPSTAPEGRWSDVDLSVKKACDTDGVEMGVVRIREFQRASLYELLTVEGWPAELIVHRMDEPPGWSVTATVGRFRDDTDRADRLVKAFEEAMVDYGKKRSME